MGEYLRLTKYVKAKDDAELKDGARIQTAINRLAYLEDLIENGLLVPRYSISQDWQYGWWCVCEVDEQSRIIAQCKTEEEAKRKLEELTNEQIYNTVIFN